MYMYKNKEFHYITIVLSIPSLKNILIYVDCTLFTCTGNLTAAIDVSFLRSNKINYILTVDSCPLPEVILELRDIHIKYIKGNFLNQFMC